MSRASRYRLWYRPGLFVHVDGVVPQPAGGGEGERVAPVPLCPPLPLGFVDALQAHLETYTGEDGHRASERGASRRTIGCRSRFGRRSRAVKALRKESARFLASRFPFLSEAIGATRMGIATATAIGPDAPVEGSLVAGRVEAGSHVVEILSGRRLMTQEIERAMGERGVSFFASVDAFLDPLVHQGVVLRYPGVSVVPSRAGVTGEWRCRRCLSPNIGFYPCHRCGLEVCPQCDDCRGMGTSSACAVLYERPLGMSESGAKGPSVRVELPFALSAFQERASKEVVESREDLLIWAACGSGKTEVTLEAIADVVHRGGRALFAVPRRDVARQLGMRLQEALPGVETVTLTGETPHSYEDARIVVSTVHQAIRFCERFELVIVDEVDAFPLNREVWLLAALERAKRPGGRLVMMTATPPERLVKRIGRGDLRCVTLPGRPHGHPLPVPEIVLEPGLSAARLQGDGEGERPPGWLSSLDALIRESLRQERRVLLFVPSVRWTSLLAHLLVNGGPYTYYRPEARVKERRDVAATRPRSVAAAPRSLASAAPGPSEPLAHDPMPRGLYFLAAVHAQDPERTEKVVALEKGLLHLLVTTSILERGVTLPRLDVVVFAADWERMYDATALVQMAGRVGRSPKDPSGRVVFFAGSTTPAMREAISAIRRFNEIARERISQF